jgi:hypothetical protein
MNAKERAIKRIKPLLIDTDECIFIEGRKSKNVHQCITIRNGNSVKSFGAHRLAYEIANGKSTNTVRHICDMPGCINPKHLKGGFQLDNIRDRDKKGRQAKGKNNGAYRNGNYCAPLEELIDMKLVPEILRMRKFTSLVKISKKLNIDYQVVKRVHRDYS